MIAKVFAFLIFAPLAGLLNAAVGVKLWNWFAIPLGAPVVGLAHFYGLTVLLALASVTPKTSTEGKLTESIIMAFLKPLMLWGLGAIAHALMVMS